MPKGDVHITWREDDARWAVKKEGTSWDGAALASVSRSALG
jgi:hypothetical protein